MDGVLALHKPKGMTSHDCVMKLRKLLKTKKVGHTGTLDPDVTGVLPICIGRATKIVEYLTNAPKTYEAEVTLGYSTTTEDASGEIIEERTVNNVIARNEIVEILAGMTGDIEQTPPMYSAVKVNGKKLYEYAREGVEVERPARVVTIYQLELLDSREVFEGERISFRFRVTASKGTYVRTLAVEIGKRLGFPAHMSDLVRTASANFTIDESLSFETIQEQLEKGVLELKSIEKALAFLPGITVNDQTAGKVKNGAVLAQEQFYDLFTVKDRNGRVLAIYQPHPNKPGLIKPVKVLWNEQD